MNKGFVFIFMLVVGLMVTSCLRQSKQDVTYDFTPLDSIISSWMDKGYYPGGAICVVKNDSVLFEKAYGSFTGDTKVYVASAGKWGGYCRNWRGSGPDGFELGGSCSEMVTAVQGRCERRYPFASTSLSYFRCTSLPACSPGGQLQSFGFVCHRDIAFGYCFCTGNSI